MAGTVKEEAQKLRQNLDRVYAAGLAAGGGSAELLEDCNDALVSKGAETADTLEQVPQRIGEIVVVEDFSRLATQLRFGNLNLFGGTTVEFVVDNLTTYEFLCSPVVANKVVEHIIVSGQAKGKAAQSMFNMDWKGGPIKHITVNVDISKAIYAGSFLTNTHTVEVIDGNPLDFSSVTSAVQLYCEGLKEVRFAPNTIKATVNVNGCKSLSNESIQSIIDGLADLTGQTAKKIEWHTDVLLKLTEEQMLAITAKNWTM